MTACCCVTGPAVELPSPLCLHHANDSTLGMGLPKASVVSHIVWTSHMHCLQNASCTSSMCICTVCVDQGVALADRTILHVLHGV